MASGNPNNQAVGAMNVENDGAEPVQPRQPTNLQVRKEILNSVIQRINKSIMGKNLYKLVISPRHIDNIINRLKRDVFYIFFFTI